MKKIILTLILVGTMARFGFGANIKEPNVSGQFYDDDPQRLSAQIDLFTQAAKNQPSDKHVEILISPHAGYVYSGAVAAHGYKAASKGKYKTIVILAPSHFYPLDTISVWPEGGFKTPLGTVDVDSDFAKKLLAMNEKFTNRPEVYEREHAVEVEIPFLQKTFKDFKIVPVIMGQMNFELCQAVAKSLNALIGDRQDVLVVVSSDMSHYHDYDFAKAMDHRTIETIAKIDAQEIFTNGYLRKMEMCGFIPVTTALAFARERGLTDVEVLRYANSGDVTGEKDRVVGYTSIVFYGKAPVAQQPDPPQESEIKPLSKAQKKKLLDIARQTIDEFVRHGKTLAVEEKDARLQEPEGAFVTLKKGGQLRGCIGHIIGDQPLYLTVRDMAIQAASQDPRFPAVTVQELDQLELEISVLSKPHRAQSVEEIIPGVHGVIVTRGFNRGLFLPQVATEWGWGREELLSQLCAHKAGLPADAWKDPRTQIDIFTADVFSYKDVR